MDTSWLKQAPMLLKFVRGTSNIDTWNKCIMKAS